MGLNGIVQNFAGKKLSFVRDDLLMSPKRERVPIQRRDVRRESPKEKERGNFITKKIRTGDIPKNDARYYRYHDHDWAVVKHVKEMCLIRDPSKRPSLLQLGEIMNTELDLYQSIRLKLHQGTAIESAQDDNIRK